MIRTGAFSLLLFMATGAANPAPAIRDTIPPEGRWTSPVEFCVIRTSQVRLAVEARDNPGGHALEHDL
jgi:hypothetical protein